MISNLVEYCLDGHFSNKENVLLISASGGATLFTLSPKNIKDLLGLDVATNYTILTGMSLEDIEIATLITKEGKYSDDYQFVNKCKNYCDKIVREQDLINVYIGNNFGEITVGAGLIANYFSKSDLVTQRSLLEMVIADMEKVAVYVKNNAF